MLVIARLLAPVLDARALEKRWRHQLYSPAKCPHIVERHDSTGRGRVCKLCGRRGRGRKAAFQSAVGGSGPRARVTPSVSLRPNPSPAFGARTGQPAPREGSESGDLTNSGFLQQYTAAWRIGPFPNHGPVGSIRYSDRLSANPPSTAAEVEALRR